jgi:hypothetical protein
MGMLYFRQNGMLYVNQMKSYQAEPPRFNMPVRYGSLSAQFAHHLLTSLTSLTFGSLWSRLPHFWLTFA